MNEKLNKLDIYKNKKCIYCGRKYPETILNIEGVVHHGGKYRCLDQKKCRRVRRKNKRKKEIETYGMNFYYNYGEK